MDYEARASWETVVGRAPRTTMVAFARQSFSCLMPLELVLCAPRGIRTPNRQIRSLLLSVDLVGSRRI
jgi:hypothetical protein